MSFLYCSLSLVERNTVTGLFFSILSCGFMRWSLKNPQGVSESTNEFLEWKTVSSKTKKSYKEQLP